jgi:hypothetical protein
MLQASVLRKLPRVLAVTLGLALATAGTAQAEAIEGAPEGVAPKPNCVVKGSPIKPGESTSAVTYVGCFDTFAEAMAAATGGKARLPAGFTAEMVVEGDMVPEATILAIDYDRTFFRGPRTLTYLTDDPTGCFVPVTGFRFDVLPIGFRNFAASTRTFSGCRRNDTFPGVFLTGLGFRCFGDCPTFPAFITNNNESKRLLR